MTFGIDDAIAAGLKIVDKFVPDPAEKAKAEASLRQDLMQWDKSQTDVNAVEAANPNLFVSGWRPSIGWTCSITFALYYIPMAIAINALWIWACIKAGTILPHPDMGMQDIMGLMGSILGIGGMRSWEKYKGLTK